MVSTEDSNQLSKDYNQLHDDKGIHWMLSTEDS